jgi:hypothetical protein
MESDTTSVMPDSSEMTDLPRHPVEVSHRLRLLWIGEQEPSWIGLALQLDADGCLEPRFRWASTPSEALTVLRDENFDCVILSDSTTTRSPTPLDEPELLLQAVRGSGYSDSAIFITSRINDQRDSRLCALDCDVLVTPNSCDSPALLPLIRRAVSNAERLRENHRLSVVHQRRLVRERNEAEHLLQQQRSFIETLEGPPTPDIEDGRHSADESNRPSICKSSAVGPLIELPDETKEFYHELLRTYVIMGSGSLASEIAAFAKLVATAGVTPRRALQFHLDRVESLVRDLGNRSARHVMARADLLALELMVHVGEEYQQRARTSE